MKIAVVCEQGSISEHFGHSGYFLIFETQGGQITGEETLPHPGHKPGFLPAFLREQGVRVLIAGGIGSGAVGHLKEKGIEVIAGASGDPAEAATAYLEGRLAHDESSVRSSCGHCHHE